ncbi:tRNA (pseudouridine(54)-N(1))-methyltransferase TrmY, partial [Halobacteriales archaeon QH_10_67_22]
MVREHEGHVRRHRRLDDLAGGAGRLDVLCRCVSAAFFLSHDIREDVRVHLVFGDAYTVVFEGRDLRHLNPDERSTAALIRTALEQREEAIGHQAVETTPGVSIVRRDFAATLETVAENTVVTLHEEGTPVVEASVPGDVTFVLSDHRGFTAAEHERLA